MCEDGACVSLTRGAPQQQPSEGGKKSQSLYNYIIIIISIIVLITHWMDGGYLGKKRNKIDTEPPPDMRAKEADEYNCWGIKSRSKQAQRRE